MAASSLSAPAFSLEDQARELQSLTLEERMKVEVDTLGYHSNGTFSLSDDEGDSPVANKSDTTQEHLLLEQFEQHLEQAMKQRQASSSKNDVTKEPYLEALLENPETVEREAPPLFFLRREGNDIQVSRFDCIDSVLRSFAHLFLLRTRRLLLRLYSPTGGFERVSSERKYSINQSGSF